VWDILSHEHLPYLCSIEGKKNKYNKLMQYTGTNRIFPTLLLFQYSHYERYIVMVKHSPELIEHQKDHDQILPF
jgi:hypothetical protein